MIRYSRCGSAPPAPRPPAWRPAGFAARRPPGRNVHIERALPVRPVMVRLRWVPLYFLDFRDRPRTSDPNQVRPRPAYVVTRRSRREAVSRSMSLSTPWAAARPPDPGGLALGRLHGARIRRRTVRASSRHLRLVGVGGESSPGTRRQLALLRIESTSYAWRISLNRARPRGPC